MSSKRKSELVSLMTEEIKIETFSMSDISSLLNTVSSCDHNDRLTAEEKSTTAIPGVVSLQYSNLTEHQ